MTSEIRKFDDAGIQALIDNALDKLPSGTHGAVLVHYDVGGALVGSVYGKLGDHFSYVGQLEWTPKRDLKGEAEIAFSW